VCVCVCTKCNVARGYPLVCYSHVDGEQQFIFFHYYYSPLICGRQQHRKYGPVMPTPEPVPNSFPAQHQLNSFIYLLFGRHIGNILEYIILWNKDNGYKIIMAPLSEKLSMYILFLRATLQHYTSYVRNV